MFNFWGSKRKQKCLILTEDGRIVEDELLVEKGYMVSHKTMEAWGLFPESLITDKKTGVIYELICERDAAPVSFNGHELGKLTKESMKSIASENANTELAQIQKKSQRNKFADSLRMVILIFVVLIVVMVVLGLITTGKLKLPSFNF